jgi:glutathione S-transferase
VRIFLAEKGLTVPTVQVDLRNGEQFTSVFRALNPACTVPVLELDDGATISDILSICRYFEELYPDPPLIGQSPEERAVIGSWLSRIDWDGFYGAMDAFRNSTPGWIPGSPIMNSFVGRSLRLWISAAWSQSISPAGRG